MGKNIIFETKDPRIIPDIMDMIQKSKVKNVDFGEMRLFIMQNLGKEDTKIWIAFDGEEINGFVLAYIVYPAVKPEVFIAWAYVDPRYKKIHKGLMTAVENWAKGLKITRISAMVRDNLEAFEKKYGFKLEYYGVAKEISIKEDAHVGTVHV